MINVGNGRCDVKGCGPEVFAELSIVIECICKASIDRGLPQEEVERNILESVRVGLMKEEDLKFVKENKN